jgi:hypothetical protein
MIDSPARRGLSKLDAVIELADPAEWARYVELANRIGPNHPNNSQKENARASLAQFNLSFRWAFSTIIQIANEARDIERRMVEGLVKAIRSGRRTVTGLVGPDLRRVTIPAEVITVQLLLPLDRDELTVGDACLICVRIQVPETGAEEEAPKAGAPKEALAILNDDERRPPPGRGRVTKIANMIQPNWPTHKPNTLADYIRQSVRKWEKENPAK